MYFLSYKLTHLKKCKLKHRRAVHILSTKPLLRYRLLSRKLKLKPLVRYSCSTAFLSCKFSLALLVKVSLVGDQGSFTLIVLEPG